MSTSTTITMLSPDGHTGDVPIANVQAAKQAGFKIAVTMQSPDGVKGYVPAENATMQQPRDSKWCRSKSRMRRRPATGNALTNPVGSGGREARACWAAHCRVGGQAIKAMVQPFAHPIDTLAGLYNTVRHPIQTGEAIGNQSQERLSAGRRAAGCGECRRAGDRGR